MPELNTLTELTLQWKTEDDTRQFAARLAHQLSTLTPEDSLFIELHGDLGAGKTTFVRHLLQAMGVMGRIKSPTYAIVESYDDIKNALYQPLNLWHFDFYRFNDPLEWEEAGFRDIFASKGIKLAEWPEKAAAELPVADVAIKIVANMDESRTIILTAQTSVGQQIISKLQ
ncbi:MAG: tRNA ((37)-N6)-threonylcarbamoyltransferase complex ATPase subunit type 1 TsaE [Pseudomonadota bacterium]